MGEIGIPRREFLYDLNFTDLLMIERGYERRHRHLWSSTRWQTYHLMSALAGSDALKKAGIHSLADLISFPWDNIQLDDDGEPVNLPSEADVERLRQMMREENAKAEAAASAGNDIVR